MNKKKGLKPLKRKNKKRVRIDFEAFKTQPDKSNPCRVTGTLQGVILHVGMCGAGHYRVLYKVSQNHKDNTAYLLDDNKANSKDWRDTLKDDQTQKNVYGLVYKLSVTKKIRKIMRTYGDHKRRKR